MLDMKFVRENPEKVIEAVHNRNGELNLDEFLALDKERREVTQQVEVLKNERNTASKEIGKLKKAGESAEEKMAEVRAIGDKIAADDARLREIEARLKEIMLSIPNVPADDCPIGKSDADNPEVRKWGEPRKFNFEPLSHWDIGEKLGILDFERGHKISGARFTVYKGRHKLLSGPAYLPARIYGIFPALYCKCRQHAGYRPAAEIRGRHVQAAGHGHVPDSYGGSSHHQPAP